MPPGVPDQEATTEMRHMKAWLGVTALALLLPQAAARAEIFQDYEPVRQQLHQAMTDPNYKGKHVDRWLIGAYWAQWDASPFAEPFCAPCFQALGGNTAKLQREFDPDAGFLVTLDYFLNEKWSIGGWYNHFDEDVLGTVSIAKGGIPIQGQIGDSTVDLWEIHGSYYLPPKKWGSGVSLQLGVVFLDQSIDIDPAAAQGGWRINNKLNDDDLRVGGNLWINKSQRITYLGGKDRMPFSLFGGIGAQGFGGDSPHLQILIGGSIGLSKRIRASASAWFADIDSDSNTRITAGLNGSF